MASEAEVKKLIDQLNRAREAAGDTLRAAFDATAYAKGPKKYFDDLVRDLTEFQNRVRGSLTDLQEIARSWERIAKEVEKNNTLLQGDARYAEAAREAYSRISTITSQIADHATSVNELSASQLRLKRAQLKEEKDILVAQMKRVNEETEAGAARKRELEKELKLYEETQEQLTALIDEQKSLGKWVANGTKEMENSLEKMITAKMEAISLTNILKVYWNQMMLISDLTYKNQVELGLTATAAGTLTENIRQASMDMKNVTFEDAVTSNLELNNQLGTSIEFSNEMIENQAKAKSLLGLSAEEAAKLGEYTILTGKGQNDITKAVGKNIDKTLNQKKALQEVLKTEGQLAAQYKNDPELIAKAVNTTTKLGMTLQQAANAANKLLDFESSIGSELEAELLTGKDLNLEKARYLALQGDSAGAAKEMMNQVGGLAEFQKMNVLQQKALADSVGMTTDELANSLKKEAELTKIRQNANQGSTAISRIEELRRAGEVDKANALQEAMANGQSLDMAQKELSAKEEMLNIQKKLATAFTMFFASPAVKILSGALGLFSDFISSKFGQLFIGFFGGAGALLALGGGIVAAVRAVKNLFLGKRGESSERPLFVKMVGGMTDFITGGKKKGGGGGGSASMDLEGEGGLSGMFKSIFKKGKKGKGGLMKGLLPGIASMALGDEAGGMVEAAMGGGGGGGGGGGSTARPRDAKGRFVSSKGATGAAGDVAEAATKGKGGFFSGLMKKAGGFLNKLNPMTYLKKAFTDKGILKKILGKIPKIGSISELAMTAYDLYQQGVSMADMKAQGATYQDIGKQLLVTVGDLGGTFLGGLLGTVVPGAGNVIGGLLGGLAGSALAGLIADNVNLDGLGKSIVDIFGPGGEKPKKMAAGGIVTTATSITAGEAGAEAIIPLTGARGPALLNKVAAAGGGSSPDMVAELRAIKNVLQQILAKEGDVTLDGQKVGTALSISARKLQ